jgi:hypothetical protein
MRHKIIQTHRIKRILVGLFKQVLVGVSTIATGVSQEGCSVGVELSQASAVSVSTVARYLVSNFGTVCRQVS